MKYQRNWLTVSVASLILWSSVDATRRPPSTGPWILPVQTICTGDRDFCCPKESCSDEHMALNADACIREAPQYCQFEVSGFRRKAYLDSHNMFHYGCTAEDSATIYLSLPYNILNSPSVWKELTIQFYPLNFNGTQNCISTDWIGEIISWPPVDCNARIDPDASDELFRFNYEDIKISQAPLGPSVKQASHIDDRLIWLNASQVLRSRLYGDNVGLRIEPSIGSNCRINHGFYPASLYIGKPRARYWPESSIVEYRAKGYVNGEGDLYTPLTAPANLVVPEFMKFKNGTYARYQEEIATTSPDEAEIVGGYSSCDEAVLRTQLDDIRNGKLQLNPACNWDILFDKVFG